MPPVFEDNEMTFLPVAAAFVTMVCNPHLGTSAQALPGFLTEAKATAPKSVKKGKEFTVPVSSACCSCCKSKQVGFETQTTLARL